MTRAPARALAGIVLALASASARASAPTPLPSALLAPLAEPEARLVLIGDAGAPPSEATVLDEAAAWIAQHAAPTDVVFLGDNYYPERTDERVEAVLGRQLGVLPSPGRVRFVAGNHDWYEHGYGRRGRFDRARIDTLAARAGALWQPPPGELGPALLELPELKDRVRVLAIDSERWRLAAAACEREQEQEQCAALRGAEEGLRDASARADAPRVIVVAHHPLRTVGEHGGCEISWLRRVLKIGGQDVHAPAYQAYIASLTRALRPHPPLLFAAGHDHSLQFARDAALGPQLVSGAGANRSPVCGAPGAAWSRNGFAAVDFRSGAAPLLRVFAQADDDSLQEVLREPLE